MITIDDIDIFILSYNREKYILETLQSLSNQTIGKLIITILDNGSTDNTKNIINNLKNSNIHFVGNDKNNAALWNFQRAQQLATKKYTILFHDDDLIHPRYLEYVVKILNEVSGLSIVCSGTKTTSNPNAKDWRNYSYNPIIYNSLSKFASLVYLGFPLNFATVVYKTEYFKEVKIDKCTGCQGVWLDTGELEQVVQEGGFLDSMLKIFK